MTPTRPRASVRRTVVLAAVLTTALPLTIVSWRQYLELSDSYTRQASSALANSALNTAAQIDALINARLDAVRLAAQNPALVAAVATGKESQEARIAMRALVGLDATHNTLAGLVDNERRLVMSTSAVAEDSGRETRDLAYPIVVASADSAGDVPQMVFLASVRDERGIQIGVLGLRTRTTALTQVLSAASSEPSTLSRVRKASGQVLAAWPATRPGGVRPRPQAWDSLPSRSELLHEEVRGDGVRDRRYRHSAGNTVLREAAFRLSAVPWYVTVSRDESVVLGPARLALQRSLLFTALVALFVGWAASYLATRFAARIEALAFAVRRFANGDRRARPPAGTTGDEIDQLGTDVSRMATELEILVDSLEERSAQLESELRERSALEERLLEARRLEAVGLVSGMVAHDFNNVLTIVRSAAETAQQALPDGHVAQADMAEIVQAVQRGADLTRRMLTIARRNGDAPRRFDAAEMVRDCSRLLARLLPGGELTVETASGSAWVYVDSTSLLQCLMNLVSNARDAAGESSARVHVTVSRTETLPALILGGEALGPGEYVAVSVRDYGVGISSDALARLAEPFFTTKASTRGTGLGLASVSHTCREAGGALAAASREGEGSTFTMLLPFAGTLPDNTAPAVVAGAQH